MAEDGGLVAIPNDSHVIPGRNTAAPAEWVIAPPAENVTGPTAVAVSADEKTVFTVTPVTVNEDQKDIARFVVRRVERGGVVHEGSVNAPGKLAGSPVILGDALLLPIADGTVYRHSAGRRPNPDRLTPGPSWVADRRISEAACCLSPVSATTFLTNDGGKKLKKWNWPASGGWTPGGAEWELRERPAGPAAILPPTQADGQLRMLIADASGSIWLFAVDHGGKPLKRWAPGNGLPVGEPTSPLAVQSDAAGRLFCVYTVEKKYLVCLDPDRDLPLWALRVGEESDATLVGSPQPADLRSWMVTEIRNESTRPAGGTKTNIPGALTLFDVESGKPVATLLIEIPGSVPAAAGRLLGTSFVLTPLSDGSVVVLPLPTSPEPEPGPKGGK